MRTDAVQIHLKPLMISFMKEFFLFVCNFNMTIDTSVTITSNVKLQYIHTLLCVESLCQFDTLCAQVVSTNMAHLNRVVFGLGMYFFLLIHCLSNSAQCATD